jgi:hypothetical protein
MTRKKQPTASLVRSSAAEYLTFVAASGTGGVEAVYADQNVWLSQKMMAQLYDVDVRTINWRCSFRNGECWAASDEDCRRSEDCRLRGWCYSGRTGMCGPLRPE